MSDLDVLIADGNSAAARRARVKLQPRDKKGRWVPTGAALLAAIRGLNGVAKKYKLKAIGGTATSKGEKNRIRALLVEDAPELGLKKNTVLEVDPKNGELDTGIKLNKDFLKKKGIDPDLQHTLPKTLAEQPQDVSDMNPQPADDLDIELADGGLNDDEDKDLRKERDQEPLAKLPPAMEDRALEGEEVGELLSTTDEESEGPSALEGDTADVLMHEVMEKAFWGDSPDLDEVLQEASSTPKPENVPAKDLQPGDVISLGPKFNNRAAKIARVENKQDLEGRDYSEIFVEDIGPDGEKREAKVGGRIPQNTPVTRLRKAADAAETPTPEKPEKPAKPEKPTGTRKPGKKTPAKKPGPTPPRKRKRAPRSEDVNLPNRKDDGKMISPSSKSVEELREKKINNLVDQDGRLLKVLNDKGKPRTVEDPNAIIDALLEENPNAKIKEDGTVVVERGEFTDNDGKKYTYEVGVQRTVGNQFMERYTLKDAETGEVAYDFYNADYKDSFAGLYGKTSGLTRTRDLLLGRDIPGNKGVDSEGVPVDKELANYFGPNKSIDQRLKYLRKTKDMNAWRLVTPEENIKKYLEGRARELNKSDNDSATYKSQFGNVRRSFVASTWEAIDLRDNELVKERLVQLLGRLPNNEESVNALVSTLKKEISERYKGTPREKELQTLPLNMQKFLQDVQFDVRARDEVPFVSEDGVSVVKVGDKVRFINNEGDMVVGEVVKLNAGSGKNGGFKDTARVRFGNETVDNLQTRNMLHTDDEVTDYAPWVRNDEKLRRRAEELGIDFEEYKRRKEDNPDFDPDDPEESTSDSGAPYVPDNETGNEGSDSEESNQNTPTTRIKPGKVTRAQSELTAKPKGLDFDNFINSEEDEDENFIRVEPSSRKEKAALKPTPQAVALKDELVAEGREVVEGLENNEEFKTKLEELKNIREEYDRSEAAFAPRYRELKGKQQSALTNYNSVRDQALAGIEDPEEREQLMQRFNFQRNYEGFPEVEKAAKEYLDAYNEAEKFLETRSSIIKTFAEEQRVSGELSIIARNYVKSELEKQGVQFGGYTTKDLVDRGVLVFTGPQKAKSTSAKNEKSIQSKYEEQFDEILSSIPKGVIESIFFARTMSSNSEDRRPLPLRVAVGRSRGHYSPSYHYTVLNEKSVGGRDSSIFDVGIHELWHAAQTNNRDISALEHAWSYGRAMGSGSVPQMPKAGPVSDYDSSERFIQFRNPTPSVYTQKTYDKGQLMFGNQDGSSEVSTTLMQGLFSNLKYVGIDQNERRFSLDADALGFAIGLLLGSGK